MAFWIHADAYSRISPPRHAGGPAFGPAFLIYELDHTQWQSMPTPVDLAILGAPTCFAQTSADVASLLLLGGTGSGIAGLIIPTYPSFGGFTWYDQAVLVTPGVNAIGMLVTNAGTAVVGN